MNHSVAIFRLILIAVTVLVSSMSLSGADDTKQASDLQKRIKQRGSEIARLRAQQKSLETTTRQQNRQLKSFEKQFSAYLANLENSEKKTQAHEEKLLILLEQSHQRDLLLENLCSLARETIGSDSNTPHQLAIEYVAELYQQELTERPVREDLQKKIDEEQAYQERIRERYMVNDKARQEQTLMQLEKNQDKAKANMEAEERIKQELNNLRNRLSALDKQLAKLRSQSKPAPQPGKTKAAPFQPGQPFAKLKGCLPWPAQGRIARGYGPFTHPTLGVKLESKGIDVSVKGGTTLKAVADGRVLYVGNLDNYGPIVALDHGAGYMTVYGNVAAGRPKTGQAITAGDSVGVVGDNTRDTSPIYHFEIRHGDQALDPSGWLAR